MPLIKQLCLFSVIATDEKYTCISTLMLIAYCQVSRFGGAVVEAAEGSGLLVGAPYAGLGLANFGKVPQCSFS